MKTLYTLKHFLFFGLIAGIALISCKKQNEWLDIKNQKALVVPETLKDFQALLDNPTTIHNAFSIYGLIGSDNFYLSDADYPSVAEVERNGYTWSSNVWVNGNSTDWNSMYAIIEYANIVLDGLQKKGLEENLISYENIKGQALFYRAISYYTLSQLFAKPYNNTNSASLGLPLKTSSNTNVLEQRSTLENTYNLMIADANAAIGLLTERQSNNRRPNKAAACALLSKIYLSKEDYSNAKLYAGEALKLNNTLLDYNSNFIDAALTYKFPADALLHPEILWYAQGSNYVSVMPATQSKGFVSLELINLYEPNDLRKSVFYTAEGSAFRYRGTYTGLNNVFCGIATNEVYLIRAESNARLHNIPEALSDLNTLLVKRYKTGTFTSYVLNNEEEVLKLILKERRKELPYVANLRWEDLRRLNQDDRFKITQTRKIGSTEITNLPGSNKYVLPIPENETQTSGIEQNQR